MESKQFLSVNNVKHEPPQEFILILPAYKPDERFKIERSTLSENGGNSTSCKFASVEIRFS